MNGNATLQRLMPPPASSMASTRSSQEQPAPSSHGATSSSFSEEFEDTVNADLGNRKPDFFADVSHDEYQPGTATTPSYASESVLVRGLQIPGRSMYASSGFTYPVILARAGVSRDRWMEFTNEVSAQANLTPAQWLTTVGYGAGALAVGALCVGFLGVIPATIIGHKVRKNKEKKNFEHAFESGTMAQRLQHWNETYFNPRNLAVRVDLPGRSDGIHSMDVSSTRAYKQRPPASSPTGSAPGSRNPSFDSVNERERVREAKARMKAVERGRIVIIPLANAQSAALANEERTDNGVAVEMDVSMFPSAKEHEDLLV